MDLLLGIPKPGVQLSQLTDSGIDVREPTATYRIKTVSKQLVLSRQRMSASESRRPKLLKI